MTSSRTARTVSRRRARTFALGAALWSLAYGALGFRWAVGGSGFPFGEGYDPWAHLSALRALRPAGGGAAIATVGFASGAIAVALARPNAGGAVRHLLIAAAWCIGLALSLVVPDARVLAVAGYAPLLIVGPLIGWAPDGGAAVAVSWPVLNQFVCLLGGGVWTATAIANSRAAINESGDSKRHSTLSAWTTPRAAARWGRWATIIAAIIPALYALTRLSWSVGIPLGGDAEALHLAQRVARSRILLSPLGLGLTALGGSFLTLGLAQPWGERVPHWIPCIGGRAVPLYGIVIPAAIASALAMAGGLTITRLWLAGRFAIEADTWLGSLPMLLWPVWGCALGAATFGYYLRRRGMCAV